jgi:hypothetical protein
MTGTESNGDANRRQTQGKQDNQRRGRRPSEQGKEGLEPGQDRSKEISDQGRSSKSAMMTNTDKDNDGRRQSHGLNQEMKAPDSVTLNPSEWPLLTKGTVPLLHAGMTTEATGASVTMTKSKEATTTAGKELITKDQTQPRNTKEKKVKPPYPIFHQKRGAKNSPEANNSMGNREMHYLATNNSTAKTAPVVHGEVGIREGKLEDQDVRRKGMEPAPSGGVSTNEGSKDSNNFGPNSNNNSMTMVVPAPGAHRESLAPMEGMVQAPAMEGAREESGADAAVRSTNEGSKDKSNYFEINSKTMETPPVLAHPKLNDNSMTTAPALMPTLTQVNGLEVTEEESIKEDKVNSTATGGSTVDSMGNLNLNPPNSNNSRTMAPLPAPVAGMKAQEDDKSGKEDWHKVKPSKKKHKVKPSKKQQKKLTFKKTPSETSKSGPMEADPQGIDSGTGGGNRSTKTATIVTPPQGATKKRKSLQDDKEDGQEEGAVGMEVEEEKTMETGTPKQPPKSVKQTSEKFISIRQTKAMSQWYLACISNKSVQGLDRDVNLTEEDLKPGSEFYGRFQWACDYSTRDKVGDDKKTVLHDPNHWFQMLMKVPNGDDLRKSEDPAKRKAARNVLEVGIDLARSPMELFKDQFVCDNRKFGLDPSEETAELVAARAAAYKFFGPVYQYKADLKSNGEVGVPVKVMRKVNAPKNSRRLDLAVNPEEAVTAAKRKALEDAEAAQEEDPPAIQYLTLTLPPSGTPPTPFWKGDDMSEEERRDYDEKQALCLDVAGRQLKETVLGIFAKDSKAEILPHTHKVSGDPYPFGAEAITADNLESRFPMNIWQLRRYLSRASPCGGDAEIQGDMDLSTVLMVPQIQEAVKLAANRNKDLLNGVKMKANECGSSRLQCVGWLQFSSTRYENKKELTENLGSILFNGKKVTEFRLQNGSPPKGIREELDLNSREDVLASKVIEVYASEEHAPNVVQFFQWAFPLQGSADPTLHRDYRFIVSSTCTYSSIGTANSLESKEMNFNAWKEHMQYIRDSACIDCINNVRALDAQISEGVDMTIGEFMMRLVDRAQDKVLEVAMYNGYC